MCAIRPIPLDHYITFVRFPETRHPQRSLLEPGLCPYTTNRMMAPLPCFASGANSACQACWSCRSQSGSGRFAPTRARRGPGLAAGRRTGTTQPESPARHLAQSGCDCQKSLAHSDFAAAPGVNRILIQDLFTCICIARHENVLLCGPTGERKSYLANGLGIETLKRNVRVLSDSVHHLIKNCTPLGPVAATHACGTRSSEPPC